MAVDFELDLVDSQGNAAEGVTVQVRLPRTLLAELQQYAGADVDLPLRATLRTGRWTAWVWFALLFLVIAVCLLARLFF